MMFDELDIDEEHAFSAALPEEPEGLPPPRESNSCIGHDAAERTLLDLINSGAMPHALIFSGAQGIGKSTMAFRLARYLLQNGAADAAQDSLFGDMPAATSESLSVDEDSPVFSQVSSGGHPDLLTIERPLDTKGNVKNNLDVETARKVTPFLRMTSADGGWRVVIVDDADTMNRNAQNALLKILEEPPNNVLLILVTHRLGAMIPTIRSRCRVLHFDKLGEAPLATLMQKEIGNTLSSDEQKLLSVLSGGSIGKVKQIIDTKGLEVAQTVLDLLQKFPNFNFVDIHHLADQAGRAVQDNSFTHIQNIFLTVVEAIIFAQAKQGGTLPEVFTPHQNMAMSYGLETWLEIFDELKAHFAQTIFSNLDKRQGVIAAFNLLHR